MKKNIAFQLQKSISVQMYMCATLTYDITRASALRSCITSFVLSSCRTKFSLSIRPQHSPSALAEQNFPSAFALSVRPQLLQNRICPRHSPSVFALSSCRTAFALHSPLAFTLSSCRTTFTLNSCRTAFALSSCKMVSSSCRPFLL